MSKYTSQQRDETTASTHRHAPPKSSTTSQPQSTPETSPIPTIAPAFDTVRAQRLARAEQGAPPEESTSLPAKQPSDTQSRRLHSTELSETKRAQKRATLHRSPLRSVENRQRTSRVSNLLPSMNGMQLTTEEDNQNHAPETSPPPVKTRRSMEHARSKPTSTEDSLPSRLKQSTSAAMLDDYIQMSPVRARPANLMVALSDNEDEAPLQKRQAPSSDGTTRLVNLLGQRKALRRFNGAIMLTEGSSRFSNSAARNKRTIDTYFAASEQQPNRLEWTRTVKAKRSSSLSCNDSGDSISILEDVVCAEQKATTTPGVSGFVRGDGEYTSRGRAMHKEGKRGRRSHCLEFQALSMT